MDLVNWKNKARLIQHLSDVITDFTFLVDFVLSTWSKGFLAWWWKNDYHCSKFHICIIKKVRKELREASVIKSVVAFPEDLSFVYKLITTCNSSSLESYAFFWPP